ncbi:MAG: GNAT family N-acetyltransferase [Dorea sp.]
MILKSGKLTEEQAIQISKWKYEDEYAIYNLPDWNTMIKNSYAMCDNTKRESFTSYVNEEDELIGFTNLVDKRSNVLFGIGVNPEYCNKGIGKSIIKSALEECRMKYPNKSIILEVRTWNIRAFNCYKSQGFEIVKIKNQTTPIGEGEFYVMEYTNV